jgi:guanine deaminase
MDRNSPDHYIEQTQSSIDDTLKFIEFCQNKNNALITPILTPRFVPSCTPELMRELGNLARKFDLPIQSHISENQDEVAWIKSLHPDLNSYTDVRSFHHRAISTAVFSNSSNT